MSIVFLESIFIVFGYLFSLCLHEFGHALCAYYGGDESVKEKGYLTFNLFKYTHSQFSLVLPLIFLLLGGFALPGGAVYINHNQLKSRLWKSAVSFAGPLANILFVLLLSIPFMGQAPSLYTSSEFWAAWSYLIYIEVSLTIFNLLPIPPLDGYGIFEPWLPTHIQALFNKIRPYGIWIVFGIFVFSPELARVLFLIPRIFVDLLGVPPNLLQQGFSILEETSAIVFLGLIVVLWLFRDKSLALYQEAQKLSREEKYEEALEKCRAALKKNSNSSDSWFLAGFILSVLGRHEDSLSAYNKTIELQPAHKSSWFNKALCLERLDRTAEAIDAYNKVLSIDSTNIDSLQRISLLLLYNEAWQEAIDIFDKLLAIDSTQGKRASHLYGKSLSLFNMERYQESLQVLEEAIKVEQNDPEIWFFHSQILYEQSHYQKAVESCERAIAINSSDPKFWFLQGSIFLHGIKAYEKALLAFNESLKIDEAHLLSWQERGLALAELKQYAEARDAFRRAIDLDEASFTNWYNLGCCYAEENNVDLSFRCLKKAFRLDRTLFKELAGNDPSLETVREHSGFQEMLQE
ncbi:MAG: tetratricopeptide repeat protein [Cyanobacteria bacterium P01_G01_bin.54]